MVEVRTGLHEEVDRLTESGIQALEAKQLKDAHRLFREAFEKMPDDPRACSFYGYTLAIVEDKLHKGIEMCMKAINSAHPDAYFFLNIGLLYIKLNKRREAVGAFKRGLQIDRSNKRIYDVWKEKLGWRRDPAIPFLSRDNFLNKAIGKMTYSKLKKAGKV